MHVKFDKQAEIIMKQQLYLESIDRKDRETNLKVLGVAEDSDALDGVNSHTEKLNKVWEKMVVTGERISHLR